MKFRLGDSSDYKLVILNLFDMHCCIFEADRNPRFRYPTALENKICTRFNDFDKHAYTRTQTRVRSLARVRW